MFYKKKNIIFNMILILIIIIEAVFIRYNYLSQYKSKYKNEAEFKIIENNYIFPELASSKQCHASTLCLSEKGTLICSWYQGTEEGSSDVTIWMSRKENDSEWSLPVMVAEGDGVPCWNPVLFKNKNQIFLFYKVGESTENWKTFVKKSYDDGMTWSVEQELVKGDEGGRGPVKNKPILLKSGAIIAPASIEADKWYCFVDRSEDNCSTWVRSKNIDADYQDFKGKGILQPTLWQDSGGDIHMFMRSSEGVIYSSESRDDGLTWSKAEKTKLPNNNSGIDIAQLKNGNLVLVYNPVRKNFGARSPISFSISKDNGKTWGESQDIEYILCDNNMNRMDTEFSYPAIIAEENDVYISYTWKKKTIAFWHIEFLD